LKADHDSLACHEGIVTEQNRKPGTVTIYPILALSRRVSERWEHGPVDAAPATTEALLPALLWPAAYESEQPSAL
jgi:hypothetical protein